MPFGGHDDPTEQELRWMAFTSLAYGAKGILYFCYWCETIVRRISTVDGEIIISLVPTRFAERTPLVAYA